MSMKFKNNAGSKLANDVLAVATGFTVLAGTGSNFPELTSDKDYFHVTLVGDDGDMEIVRVTQVNGDVLTCVRAQEDTVAKDWPAGTRVENRITAEFLNQVATGDTIKFDQKTIKTNTDGVSAVDPAEVYGPATTDTLGVVKVDNDTITIDEDGTLRSKSIPFEKGALSSVSHNVLNPAVVHFTTEYVDMMVPDYSSGNYFILGRDISLGDNYVQVERPGFYYILVNPSFISLTEDVTQIQSILYKNTSPIVAANVDVSSAVANPDFVLLTCVVYADAGDKLYFGYGGNVNNVTMQTFSFQIFRMPVTNEYQVQNSTIEHIYSNNDINANSIAYGGKALGEWRKLSFIGKPVDIKLTNFELSDNTVDFVCKKAGYYVLFFEHSTVGTATSQDISLGLAVDDLVFSSTNFTVNTRLIDYDAGALVNVVQLQEGNYLSVCVRYSDDAILNPKYATLKILGLPSTVSNNSSAGDSSSGTTERSPAKYHAIRFSQMDQPGFNLVNYVAINNPANLIVNERKENTDGLLEIEGADGLKFLEDGVYIVTYNYGINLGSSYNGDSLFLATLNEIGLETCTDRLAGQGLNDDFWSHSVVCAAKAGDVLKFWLRTPTAGQFRIVFHEVAAVKIGSGGGSGSTSANVKIDNTTIIKNDVKELSVNTEGLVAESGIDNFLEVVDNKLAVRGVQTDKNELWNGGSFTTSNEGIADTNQSIVKFGTMKDLAPFERRDNIVEVIDNKEFKILKSGMYHVHATSLGTAINFLQLYKKNTDGTYTVIGGSIQSSYVANEYASNLELHVDLPAGAVLVFARNTAVTTGAVYVDFQRFADAALLAPALTTMHNELWSRVFITESVGTNTLGSGYKSLVFGDESSAHPFHSYNDPIVSLGSDRETFTILKDGVYHISASINATDTSTAGISAPFRIYKNVNNAWILAGTAGSVIGKDNIVRGDFDLHLKSSAGDVYKFGIYASSDLHLVAGCSCEFQRFADTLEHSNHGISQDAGNTAQVGSDLGIFVPAPVIPDVTPESFTGILPIEKGGTGNAAGHAVSADTAPKWAGSTKYVSTASPSGGVSGDIWFQYI